jgi:uncharacterized UBP type Zn finger protein
MSRSSSSNKDNNNEQCMHANSINENVQARTQACEECEREGKSWVALRLCLACGHVGCCDSSAGLHGTKHYRETGHPIITALPNKSWKWCYVDKKYI